MASTTSSISRTPPASTGSTSSTATRSPSQASQTSQGSQHKQHLHQESASEDASSEKKDSPGRALLRSWLHSLMSVVLSDGRTLVGTFVCTDRDTNIILSSCTEHLPHTHTDGEEEARMLGLAMVPGRHVVSLSVDERTISQRGGQQSMQGVQQVLQGVKQPPQAEERETAASTSQQQRATEHLAQQPLDPPVGYT